MTIHTLFYNLDSSISHDLLKMKVQKDDVILISTTTDDSPMEFETKFYNCVSNSNPFQSRRSLSSIWDNAHDLDENVAKFTEKAGDKLVYYSHVDIEHDQVIIEILQEVDKLTPSTEASPNLTALVNHGVDGNKYKRLNIDGSDYVQQVAVIQQKNVDNLLTATSNTDLVSLINIVDPAVKYAGFTPARTRNVMLSRNNDNGVITRELILCFLAYSNIGNNISKLSERRVDVTVSAKVLNAVSKIGVVKVDRTRDALTLPRIVIAFMPQYLIFRKFLTSDLQDQTESTLDVVYKDLAFDGCEKISKMNGYEDYHKQFSNFIYKGKEEVKMDDPQFLRSLMQYRKVARQGYNSDSSIHNHMTAAIQASALNQTNAVKWITDKIAEYRTVT